MKQIIRLMAMGLLVVGCNEATQKTNGTDTAFAKAEIQDSPYQSYGAEITSDNAISAAEVSEKYTSMKAGDTATVKFEAPINSVCANKGCWMRLATGEEEVFVKFKDYGFFVPLDAKGDAIVEGKAYLEVVSVDELKHMAEDAGKTAGEIAAITEPKREMRFMANGVLIKSN